MSKKYIIQPDGSILSSGGDLYESNNVSLLTKEVVNKGNKSYKQANFEFEGLFNNSVDLDGEDQDLIEKNLFNFMTSNKNFNFPVDGSIDIRAVDEIKSFKNFNSFTDNFEETGMFANEIELIGAHPAIGDFNKLYSKKWLFFIDYILEISAFIALIEIAASLNEFFHEDNDIVENTYFRLGSNTFQVPDFISPYFLKVLNYPTKNCSLNDRLASFFLGLNLYLGGDEIHKQLRALSFDTYQQGLSKGFLRVTTSLLLYALEAQLQSGAKDNLIDLLIRKFQMQSYWHRESLYKYKSGKSIEKYLIEFKYYYFKFAIERIHVGLNVLNNEFLGLTYDVNVELPSTRVGISTSKQHVPIKLGSNTLDQKYNWNSGKSWSRRSQTIRNRVLPQALQMPVSFLANKMLNKNISDIENGKPLVNVNQSLMQNFVINKTNRIDAETVKLVEHHMESEYVPFYLHDIRTNEILAFHAFIDNLTDNYTPNYQSTKGFGRIDDVKNYVDTTRNIQLSFTMASTSPEDHDLMWYQINKIVSMCYPQWSDGFVSNDTLSKYPFTQMPTASPLIRLRVGDLIKSNYSKQSLSRLHGIGDRNNLDDFLKDAIFNEGSIGDAIKKHVDAINKKIEKLEEINNKNSTEKNDLNKQKIELQKEIKDLKIKIEEEKEKEIYDHNFQFGIGVDNPDDIFIEPKKKNNFAPIEFSNSNVKMNYEETILTIDSEIKNIDKKLNNILAMNNLEIANRSDLSTIAGAGNMNIFGKDTKKYYLSPGVYRAEKILAGSSFLSSIGISDKVYVKIDSEEIVTLKEDFNKYCKVSLSDKSDYVLYVDKTRIREMTSSLTFSSNTAKNDLETLSNSLIDNNLNAIGKEIDNIKESLASNIMDSTTTRTEFESTNTELDVEVKKSVINNPFTAAFESARGKGLAGFITSLNIGGLMDSTWETSRNGSKAPMLVKIDIGFSPTHDIPPGLDHHGMMRAPTYNVGRLMNDLFDDAYEKKKIEE